MTPPGYLLGTGLLALLALAPIGTGCWGWLPDWARRLSAGYSALLLLGFALFVLRGDWWLKALAVAALPAVALLVASLWQPDLLAPGAARGYVLALLLLVFLLGAVFIIGLNQFR